MLEISGGKGLSVLAHSVMDVQKSGHGGLRGEQKTSQRIGVLLQLGGERGGNDGLWPESCRDNEIRGSWNQLPPLFTQFQKKFNLVR